MDREAKAEASLAELGGREAALAQQQVELAARQQAADARDAAFAAEQVRECAQRRRVDAVACWGSGHGVCSRVFCGEANAVAWLRADVGAPESVGGCQSVTECVARCYTHACTHAWVCVCAPRQPYGVMWRRLCPLANALPSVWAPPAPLPLVCVPGCRKPSSARRWS